MVEGELGADVALRAHRPPLILLGASAAFVLVSLACWLVGGKIVNLAGYAAGIVVVLVLSAFFDRLDNGRRQSAWYVSVRWAGRTNSFIRVAGLAAGVLNLWAFATAVAR